MLHSYIRVRTSGEYLTSLLQLAVDSLSGRYITITTNTSHDDELRHTEMLSYHCCHPNQSPVHSSRFTHANPSSSSIHFHHPSFLHSPFHVQNSLDSWYLLTNQNDFTDSNCFSSNFYVHCFIFVLVY